MHHLHHFCFVFKLILHILLLAAFGFTFLSGEAFGFLVSSMGYFTPTFEKNIKKKKSESYFDDLDERLITGSPRIAPIVSAPQKTAF